MSGDALPQLMTEKEVAMVLRCSPATIGRERRAGRLGCITVRRRVFITPEQVADYIKGHTQSPTGAVPDDFVSANRGHATAVTLRPADALALARATFGATRRLVNGG